MPRITVDVSQVQPAGAGSIPASQADYLPKMPPARGNAKAGDPVRQVDAQQKDIVAGIQRPTIPAIEDLRVPASSQYQDPPSKVVAASDRLEPSA